jgi:outer membrane protein TolC
MLNAGILRAEEVSLTLNEAVVIALSSNRDILLKEEDLKKAKLKISESQAGLLPSLDLTATRSDTRGYYDKDLTQTTTQATLKQYLYKGGEIINTIRYNGYNFEVTKALLDQEKFDVIVSVKNAFYTLLLADEFAALNKAILTNSQAHLDFIRERYKSGQASDQDVSSAESSLSNVNQAYQASLNDAESTSVLLCNLLYLDKDIRIKPQGEFNYEAVQVAYDEAFLKAMSQRPEIKQYEAQEKADKSAIEVKKAAARPSIYASWDYYSRDHIALSTAKGWNDYNVIGVTVSWPIFDGWETKAKVQQAIIDLKETQLLKEKTTKDIAKELKDAYISLKDAIAKIQAVESDVKFYGENLSSTKEKYQKGITSGLDVSDAALKYEVALFNKKQAIYDYITANIDFDKATGGM